MATLFRDYSRYIFQFLRFLYFSQDQFEFYVISYLQRILMVSKNVRINSFSHKKIFICKKKKKKRVKSNQSIGMVLINLNSATRRFSSKLQDVHSIVQYFSKEEVNFCQDFPQLYMAWTWSQNCGDLLSLHFKKNCVKSIHLQLTVWKNEKFSLTKKYFVKSTSNLLCSRTVTFTKFLPKMCEREFP